MESGFDSGVTDDRPAELRRLKQGISAIYHDINNPISIVAGNAELLLEMAVSAGLGPEFVDPLADIGKATDQITEQVERLIELRDRIA